MSLNASQALIRRWLSFNKGEYTDEHQIYILYFSIKLTTFTNSVRDSGYSG